MSGSLVKPKPKEEVIFPTAGETITTPGESNRFNNLSLRHKTAEAGFGFANNLKKQIECVLTIQFISEK